MSTVTVPVLPRALSWLGGSADVAVGEDRLTLGAGPHTDWFVDPDGSAVISNAPFLGFAPEGDFQFGARVSGNLKGTFDAGVLAVYAGERSWAKLCCELSPQGERTVVSVVTRGSSDDCNSFELSGDSVALRVSRRGQTLAFHARDAGTEWSMIRYFTLEGAGAAQVGFLAQSPMSGGCTACFEGIWFRAHRLRDLRDGS